MGKQEFLQAGDQAAQAGQIQEALQHYTRLVEQAPNDPDGYLRRAAMYQVLNEPQKIVEECDRALALKPDSGSAYGVRAIGWGMQQQDARALQDFGRAVELEPLVADHWINRAKTYRRMGMLREAADDFLEAARADLKFAVATKGQSRLALECMASRERILREMGQTTEADDCARLAQEMAKDLQGRGGCAKKAAAMLFLVISPLLTALVVWLS